MIGNDEGWANIECGQKNFVDAESFPSSRIFRIDRTIIRITTHNIYRIKASTSALPDKSIWHVGERKSVLIQERKTENQMGRPTSIRQSGRPKVW